MTETYDFPACPENFAALSFAQRRDPCASEKFVGNMSGQIFYAFPILLLPCAGNGKNKEPASFSVGLVSFCDCLHVAFRTVCRVAHDNNHFCPLRRPEFFDHFAEKPILILIIRMVLGQNNPEIDRNSEHIPAYCQNCETNSEEPWFAPTLPTLPGQRIFFALSPLPAAVSDDINRLIIRRRKTFCRLLREPVKQKKHGPVPRTEQTAEMPLPDTGRTPS